MDILRPKLWTKDFIVVSSVHFFMALIFYLLVVIIGVYAVDHMNATTSQAGLITGMFIIGSLIGRLFSGRFIDRIGYKRIMFSGLVLFILTTALYHMDLGINFLIINRLLHGFAMGMASTATGTIVAQIIPAARKGEGIGYYSMTGPLSTAIGPFIGLYMSQHTSFQVIFSFCLALGVISLIIALFLNVPTLVVSEQSSIVKGFKLSGFVEPKALPIAFITLIIAFCYSSVLTYINFYAIEINLVSTASFFFLVYSIAVLVSRPFTGRLLDSKGANYVMYPAFIIFGVGMLLLSSAIHNVTLLIAGILIGLGFGNMQSSTQTIAVKLSPPHRIGLATSTFYIFLDAGMGLGPYLLGIIIPLTGFRTMYAILSVVILASTVLYYFLHGKNERAGRTST